MKERYAWPLSVAPMMEVTDRYWRYFARGLSKKTLLYSEMVVANCLIHNPEKLEEFLGCEDEEAPMALQLGGNDPEGLGKATELSVGYLGRDNVAEVNLNCGCPSATVAGKQCFGARLMLDPEKVRRILAEMIRKSAGVPVTVKHRLGTDIGGGEYQDTANFVKIAASAGVRHFVVHCRIAILGRKLSCDQNRSVPPLMPEVAARLSRDFPELTFAINGGLQTLDQCRDHLDQGDVVSAMVGRAAWYKPFDILGTADTTLFKEKRDPSFSRRDVVLRYLDYLDSRDFPADAPIYRPLYYAFAGLPGAKRFRIYLVDAAHKRRQFLNSLGGGGGRGHCRVDADSPLPSSVVQDALAFSGINDALLDTPLTTPVDTCRHKLRPSCLQQDPDPPVAVVGRSVLVPPPVSVSSAGGSSSSGKNNPPEPPL